jgi:GNAT superfamily N-acetyltransferase
VGPCGRRSRPSGVRADVRGDGLGARLLTWAEDEARARGGLLLQLTSDRTCGDAHRFYENLGFEATHVEFTKRL